MRISSISHAVGWLAMLAMLAAGCATTSPGTTVRSPLPDSRPSSTAAGPAPTPAPASPLPGTRVGTTASGGQITSMSPTAVVLDSLPSAEALSVLETIPEPLSPAERVAPPKLPASHPGSAPSTKASAGAPPTDSAVVDSARSAGSDEAGDVPVPQPTRVLGDRPTPAGGAPPPSSPPPSTPAPARPDTCWRVQIAAVPDAKRAEALRSAAESQLLVPWVIDKDGQLFKVRSKGCSGAVSAEEIRKRAVAAGFTKAFRYGSPSP
jgi:hypothetical protein